MESPNIIENDVVSRAQAGDEIAARQIIEKMHQPMLGFIYRILGPRYRDQMEDIAQDVFLKVFRALHRFDVDRGVRFSTWVFTFTRNHCLDLVKKKKLPTFSLTSVLDDGGQRSLEDRDQIGPEQQTQGIEIGERMDAAPQTIDEGTVKSRLHRARLALREVLADLNPSYEAQVA